MAEAAGLSRQAVYDALRRRSGGNAEGIEALVVAMVAAGGATSRTALASALGIPELDVSIIVDRLQSQGALSSASAGYSPGTHTESILMGPEGDRLLQDLLRRALSARPEHWTAYLALDPGEVDGLVAAAEQRYGSSRATLIPIGTIRNMAVPELALAFDVGDEVALFNEAATAWHALREGLGLAPRPAQVVAFSPPRGRLLALEAFGRGIAEVEPKLERRAMRAIVDARGRGSELTTCVGSLTAAANALR